MELYLLPLYDVAGPGVSAIARHGIQKKGCPGGLAAEARGKKRSKFSWKLGIYQDGNATVQTKFWRW